MGQKVRPTGFRLGITESWKSKWYASKKEFSTLLGEDLRLRKYILNKYQYSGIPRIEIERTRDQVIVHLHTARPGIIIGRKGQEVDKLNPRNPRILVLVEDVLPQPQVFTQQRAEFLLRRIPLALPRFGDTEPESGRSNFLSHNLSLTATGFVELIQAQLETAKLD